MTAMLLMIYAFCELAGCVISTVLLALRSASVIDVNTFVATLGYWVCIPVTALIFVILFVIFLIKDRKR